MAFKFYEQALPIMREAGDRVREASTLNNMGTVYLATGQSGEALKFYEQALPIMREAGDRGGEAATLKYMSGVYQAMGQLREALKFYEQALPIIQEVGDRAEEATMLNGLAYLLQSMNRYTEALTAFEQSIALEQHVSHTAGEIAGLVGLALLLYQHLNRLQDAMIHMERAIALLVQSGLPQDAAGHTVADLQCVLQLMQQEGSSGTQAAGPSMLSAEDIQHIVTHTIAVMTVAQDHHTKWREATERAIQDAQQRGVKWQIEVDFFTAVLAILDGQQPALSEDHPHAQAIVEIQNGIAAGGLGTVEVSEKVLLAIRDFLNTENWQATRQVVEAQHALLFRPEVEAIFEANIAQARAAGEQRIIEILELHFALLCECKANGIIQAFEKLAAAREHDLLFDAELVPRVQLLDIVENLTCPCGRMSGWFFSHATV